MRIHFSIGGGGSKGSFSAGFISELIDSLQEDYLEDIEIVQSAGTSVGGFLSAAIGTRDPKNITTLWDKVANKNSKVYKKGLWPLRLIAKGYMYNFDPLYKTLKRELLGMPVKIPFWVSVWNITKDVVEYKFFPKEHFIAEKDVKYIYAGGLMPLYGKCVEIDGDLYADGGIKDITPNDVLFNKMMKPGDHLIVINHAPAYKRTNVRKQPGAARMINLMVDAWMTEILLDDVAVIRKKNQDPNYIHVKVHYIEPDTDLGGPLDFSKNWFMQGFEQARQLIDSEELFY